MANDTQPSAENKEPKEEPKPTKENGFSKAKKFWQGVDMTLRLLAVASTLMLFLFGLYQLHNWRTTQNIQKYLAPYEVTNTLISTRLGEIKQGEIDESRKIDILNTQYKILTERKKHHKELATYFISNYYASLLVVLFATIGGGIVIFLIATRGWGRTSNYIKVTFLALVFMATFYAVFPNVFGQKQNFESNLSAFIKYDNLQYEIFNYMAVRPQSDTVQNFVATDSMITYINNRIIELNNMYISTGNTGLGEINEMVKTLQARDTRTIPQLPPQSQSESETTNE